LAELRQILGVVLPVGEVKPLPMEHEPAHLFKP
jgi:hypothetical protein